MIAIGVVTLAFLGAALFLWNESESKTSPLAVSFLGYTNLTPALQRTIIGDTNSLPGIRYGMFSISNQSSSKVVRYGPFYPENAPGEYGLSDYPTTTLDGGATETVFVVAPPDMKSWRLKALYIKSSMEKPTEMVQKIFGTHLPVRLRERFQAHWALSEWVQE